MSKQPVDKRDEPNPTVALIVVGIGVLIGRQFIGPWAMLWGIVVLFLILRFGHHQMRHDRAMRQARKMRRELRMDARNRLSQQWEERHPDK